MKNRDLIYIVIIILLAAGIAYMIRQNRIQQEFAFARNVQFADTIEKTRAVGDSAAARADRLEIELVKLRDSLKVSENARIELIRLSKKRAVDLKPEVAVLIDSVPPLKAYVNELENTIAEYDTLVYSMNMRHDAEIINLDEQLKERGKQILNERAVSELLTDRNANLEKDLAKSQRGKRVRNYVIAGLLGAILIQIASK